MEKAQLYEQVKRHSEELRVRVLEATAELAEQNELLRRQALELEQVSALKSQFLANISHELRTPLNAMIGYTHMLLEGVAGELEPAQRDKLRRVDSNTRHLLSIINDLLDIARIESGKLPVNLETFGVAELIDEVTAEMEPLIHSSGLDFRVELGEVPDVRSDRQKVKQIVLNLLSNALKFTERGSVAIGVLYESAVDRVAIAVADTGPGITVENQRKIFEAFAHATGSAPRRFGGTGLGLSICRRLATVLGGEIRLHSRPGEGSVFTLHLPRQTRKR
jgi:signal transduction histidine kinase